MKILIIFLFAITSQFALGSGEGKINLCGVNITPSDISTATCKNEIEMAKEFNLAGCNSIVCPLGSTTAVICVPKDNKSGDLPVAIIINNNQCQY